MPSLPPEPAPRSDGELLRLFLMSRDQTSLTELVTRHAAMVRGVCQRLLGNTPDADDAFQATFLVLVRQGDRIRRPQSLAAWLYGVAQRIAQRVRRQRSRAVVLVQEDHAMIESDPLAELATRHDVALFDTELARLPEKYRAPIVLHHLEGKTQREIAAELKLTEGAVDGLLKRGRNELRVRLARRGVVFGVTVAVLEQSQQAIAATSSQSLIESTVHGILTFEPVLHPEVPRPPSARLAQQEITTMGLYHAGKVAAWTVAASLLFGTAGVGVSSVRSELGAPELIAAELTDVKSLGDSDVVLLAGAESQQGQDEKPAGDKPSADIKVDQQPPVFTGNVSNNVTTSGSVSIDTAQAKKLPHQGEKISLVGDIDLDGDGKSDREQLRKFIQDAGMIIDTEVDDEGDKHGEGISDETKLLVVGRIPTYRGTGGSGRDRARKYAEVFSDLRKAARLKGVRTVAVNDLLAYIDQPQPAQAVRPELPPRVQFRDFGVSAERIVAALHEDTEVNFVDITLRDALNYLEDLHRFDVIINEQDITDDGLSFDPVINLELSGAELHNTLDLMLEPHKLDYVIKNEVLMITTRDKAKSPKYQELRIYNVEGLPPLIDKAQRDKDGANQKIEAAIKDAVGGGDEWTSEGGTSTLQWTPAGLIVRTNQRMHAEIEEFLQQLRRSDGQGE